MQPEFSDLPAQPRSKGERILSEATFSPEATKYHVLTTTLAVAASIIGIPLLLIVVPLASWYYTKYYARLRVLLTTRNLNVSRGVLNREDKSIPLEKITDLAVFQGPVMRMMNLKGLRVETAGQSNAAGALVSVIGVENIDEFRDLVLNQRDRVTDDSDGPTNTAPSPASGTASPAPSAHTENGAMLEALNDIRETLKRIEQKFDR